MAASEERVKGGREGGEREKSELDHDREDDEEKKEKEELRKRRKGGLIGW